MKRHLMFIVMVLFLVSTFLVSAADVDQKVVNTIQKNQKASVIVLLKDGTDLKSSSDISSQPLPVLKNNPQKVLSKLKIKPVGSKKVSVAGNYDLELKYVYSSVNGFSGEITSEGLAKLQSDSLVDKIVPNEIRHVSLVDSIPLINANDVWNITVNSIAIDGSGQTVCVIDTGVDYTHAALGGCTLASFLAGTCSKVPFGYDYANLDDDPQDDHGHGTHVAGIVASTDEVMGPYKGVAPNTKIVAMKVCDASGSCRDSDVIAGIERCINDATVYNISVISISLGGDQTSSYCDGGAGAAYASIINQAVGQNISIVAATGNTGSGYPNATAGIAVPACIQNSTRVTASDKSDNMASYAFRHSAFIDIVAAPGSSIVSLQPGGATALASGTSMSTPHVSGVIALLQQFSKAKLGRALTSSELKSVLNSTRVVIDDSSNSGMLIPRVDVYAALLSLDTVDPELTFFSPTPINGTTLNTSSLTIEIHGSETIQNVVLQWNGVNESMSGSGYNYTLTKTGLVSGTYMYQVIAQDTAGNFGESELRTIILQGKPTIIFTYPVLKSENYVSQQFSLNISMTDKDFLSYANYSITDALGNVYQSSYLALNGALEFTFSDSVNISSLVYDDGNYTITVYTNDTLGEESSATEGFIVDKTFPAVYSSSISPETIYNTNNVTFRVNLSDLYLSGTILESNFTGTWTNYSLLQESGDTYYYTVLSGNFSNQETVGYRFYAGDRAGNLNVSDSFSFIVQNRAPRSLAISSPTSGQVLEIGSSFSASGSATDEDSDALTYSWNFGDNNLLTSGQNSSHTYNTTGAYTLLFNASDSYSSNSTTVSVMVNDTALPTIVSETHDSTLHLERDKGQNVSVNTFDYSGILSMTITSEGITVPVKTCTKDATTWICSWSWNDFSAGSRSFIVNVTDNFTPPHLKSNSYSFTVLSCSDASKNGDEEGVDCGGSCTTVCSTSSDSSSSSSSGGGGGGGSSSNAATAESNSDSEDEPLVEDTSETSSSVSSSDAESESLEQNEVEVAPELSAQAEGVSIGNRLTGFFGKIVPSDFNFKFSTKGVAITAMSVVIIGLGSLYFFVLRK